jgi:hypothetical protein
MLKPGFRERFRKCVHKLDAGNVARPLGQVVASMYLRLCVEFQYQSNVRVMPMIQKSQAFSPAYSARNSTGKELNR